jgi:hypothetical protein
MELDFELLTPAAAAWTAINKGEIVADKPGIGVAA